MRSSIVLVLVLFCVASIGLPTDEELVIDKLIDDKVVERQLMDEILDDVAEKKYPAFSPAQRMARLQRFREKQNKFRPASAGDCSNGIGPTCGTFPIPDNYKITPANNLLQPVYPTTIIQFPVFDAAGVGEPSTLTDQYGNLLDYPTTRNGKGAQSHMALICPTTAEAAAASPLLTLRQTSAALLRSLGMWLPDSNTTTIALPPGDMPYGWDLFTDLPGWGFTGQEAITRTQGLVSQGACALVVMVSPADNLGTSKKRGVAAHHQPGSAIVDLARNVAIEKGINWIESNYPGLINTRRGQVTGTGQSIGGEAIDVDVHGWNTQNIPKKGNPLYGSAISWDSSYEFYASGKDDFPGYSFNRVTLHSQTTGQTLGFGARLHRMNVNPGGINAAVNTYGTTHPQGCVPDTCIWSIAAVQTGAYGNLAKYNQSDYWVYKNQTFLEGCAPAGHNAMVGDTVPMSMQNLINIQWLFTRATILATRLGQAWASAFFSRAHMDQVQNAQFQGQKLFTYQGNQPYGPDILGGCIQGLQMARAWTFYLFSYIYDSVGQIENSEFYNPTSSDNTQSPYYGNYCDCLRDGQPCTAFIETYQCGNNTCAFLPQPTTAQLSAFPGNNCNLGVC